MPEGLHPNAYIAVGVPDQGELVDLEWNIRVDGDGFIYREPKIVPRRQPAPRVMYRDDILEAAPQIRRGIGGRIGDFDAGAVWGHLEEVAGDAFAAKPVKKPKAESTMAEGTVGRYIRVATKGTFGIEIEVEGKNLIQAIAGKWTDKNDGSLRGESREYILRKPLDLDAAKEALTDLSKALAAKEAVLDFSFRTSVHVHLNVLDMDKKTLHVFLYLAHLFENVLVRYSGTERTGNRFCLRCVDAGHKIDAMYYFLTKEGFQGMNEDFHKYSAINLCPITTQGSVEFRSMRGTLDSTILFPWLDVLQNIRNMSKVYTIKDIAAMTMADPDNLIKLVFGDYLPLFDYPDLKRDLRHSYSLLIEMPYLKLKN